MTIPNSHSYHYLTISSDGAVATRHHYPEPDRANALSHDHLAELEQAALSFREDADTRRYYYWRWQTFLLGSGSTGRSHPRRYAPSRASPQSAHGSAGDRGYFGY